MMRLLRGIRSLAGRVFRRRTGETADAILARAYARNSDRPYPEDVFRVCRLAAEAAAGCLSGYSVILVKITPVDHGDYALNIVFGDDTDLERAVNAGVVREMVAQATELFTLHGQNPGFNIAYCMTSYATALAVSGSWENYLKGRGALYVDPQTGCLIPEPK